MKKRNKKIAIAEVNRVTQMVNSWNSRNVAKLEVRSSMTALEPDGSYHNIDSIPALHDTKFKHLRFARGIVEGTPVFDGDTVLNEYGFPEVVQPNLEEDYLACCTLGETFSHDNPYGTSAIILRTGVTMQRKSTKVFVGRTLHKVTLTFDNLQDATAYADSITK